MSLAGSCFSWELAARPLYGAFVAKEFARRRIFVLCQYFCSISKTVSSPDAHFALIDARSRLAVAPNLAACSAFIRPSLDGFEGDGTLTRSGQRSEGSPLSGAVQPRHNLVSGRSKDPNHDAVMRIGSEAPKRRTHSSSRHESQGACRGSATSNRHRRSVTCGQGRNYRDQHSPFIVPDA